MVGTKDGADVLSATGSHLDGPVSWCPEVGAFAEPWHGTIWDPAGRWLLGPAGSGLRRLPTHVLGDGRVSVLEGSSWVRDEEQGGPPLPRAASVCGAVDAQLVPPPLPPQVALDELDGVEDGRTVLVEAVLRVEDGRGALCPTDGRCAAGRPVDSTLFDDIWLAGDPYGEEQECSAYPGRWQVRVDGAALVDAARSVPLRPFTASCDDVGALAEAAVLDVPSGDTPSFAVLDDGRPVAVVREAGGAVRVLSATTRPFLGIPQLVAWCPGTVDEVAPRDERVDGFLTSGDISSFLPDGTWSAGPAQERLARYAIDKLEDARVRVLFTVEEQYRPASPGPEQVADCVYDDVPGDLAPFSELAILGVGEAARHEGERVAVEGALVIDDGRAVVCDRADVVPGQGCDGATLQVAGAQLDQAPGQVPVGVLIGTVQGGALADAAWSASKAVDVVLVEQFP